MEQNSNPTLDSIKEGLNSTKIGLIKSFRGWVSKDKVRTKDDVLGIDLDLTYITPNLIG